jgi:probable rRNA maturation factor
MQLYLRDVTTGFTLDMERIRKHLRILLHEVDEADSSISLSFVHDDEIAEINLEHRGKDRPTDVLSFPIDGEGDTIEGTERMLGDIIISLDTALAQAKDYDADLDAEVERLLIHGVLHLLGHDHEEEDEREEMQAEERRLASAIGLPWPYLQGEAV